MCGVAITRRGGEYTVCINRVGVNHEVDFYQVESGIYMQRRHQSPVRVLTQPEKGLRDVVSDHIFKATGRRYSVK